MFRPITRRQLIVDIVVALVLWLASSPAWIHPSVLMWGVHAPITWTGAVVSLFMVGALAIRRLSPALALTTAWLGAVTQMLMLLPPMFINVTIFGVLFATAAYGTVRTARAGLISVFVGSTTIVVYFIFAPMDGTNSMYSLRGDGLSLAMSAALGWAAAAFGLGLSYTLGVLARTRMRARQTERERDIAAALAVAEQERARIARDMHDVVAHSLAVVIAQADGARYAAPAQPELAEQALATIGRTARSALADVRLLLTQLRHSQAEGPQPTLADLEALYAQVRGAGIDLRVSVDPVPASEPPGAIQLAIYRILQEALTNAIRHGDGTPVDVELAFLPTNITVAVRNRIMQDGEPARSGGHGLIGMRERATLVGGTLEAGVSGEDFVVSAEVPIRKEAA